MKAARASERRWKKGDVSALDGVPVSIKELVRVKGWPASMGSKLTDKSPADADAPAVTRLREAGAIVFAQSTSSEYGHKGVTDSPLHGISRNPWKVQRTPAVRPAVPAPQSRPGWDRSPSAPTAAARSASPRASTGWSG